MTGPLLRNSRASHGMSTFYLDDPVELRRGQNNASPVPGNCKCLWRTAPVLIIEGEVNQQY